jgi:hypothetical protein
MDQDQDNGAGRDPPPADIDDAPDISDELLEQEVWLRLRFHGHIETLSFDEL